MLWDLKIDAQHVGRSGAYVPAENQQGLQGNRRRPHNCVTIKDAVPSVPPEPGRAEIKKYQMVSVAAMF